jgi:hypothetical protein
MSAPDTQSIKEFQDLDGARVADEAKFRDTIASVRGHGDLVLPPADTKRWSSRRKAAVIVAMRTGAITREQARERYLLSEEELAGWETALETRGIRGLLVTRPRSHRPAMRAKL